MVMMMVLPQTGICGAGSMVKGQQSGRVGNEAS